jgi:hypothetical protein
MTTPFVSPTGYIDLDNDCQYSIDRKSTRSREEVDPKTDLAFYFDTYIVPKYGLNNINVNNVASFMKDLEMNWTKIDPELKPKVLDIMVDGILAKNSSFKSDLLNKLGVSKTENVIIPESKSNFGAEVVPDISSDKYLYIAFGLIVLGIFIYLASDCKPKGYQKVV